MEDELRILTLTSDAGRHSGPSGYNRLNDYLTSAHHITQRRSDPRGFFARTLTRTIRLGAQSRWYRIGSLLAELRALRDRRFPHYHVIHMFWGDLDWGYLDRFLPHTTAFVVTLHNPPSRLREIFRSSKRLRSVDRYILLAPNQAEALRDLGVSDDRWEFIPHGVDTEFFRPRLSPARRNSKAFRVLHIGAYLRDFETLSQTTRIADQKEFVFDLVCPRSSISAYTWGENVRIHEGVSSDELRDLYQTADMLLMTATEAAANNAVLEGMACGLPIVAQRVGGLASYLGEGPALFASPHNALALVEHMNSLRKDEDLRFRMANRARQRACEFSWKSVAMLTKSAYFKAASERDSRGS